MSAEKIDGETAQKQWAPVNEEGLALALSMFYEKTGNTSMTDELVAKAVQAYLPHQALLHHRLFAK